MLLHQHGFPPNTHTRVGQFQGQRRARIRHWIDRCNKSLLHHPHTKLLPCRWPSIHRYLRLFINRVVWQLHPSIRKNSRCLEEPWRPVDNIIDDDGNLDRRTLVVELVRSACHKVCFFNLWVNHQEWFELLERKNSGYEGNAVVREKTIKRRGQSWLTTPIPHSFHSSIFFSMCIGSEFWISDLLCNDPEEDRRSRLIWIELLQGTSDSHSTRQRVKTKELPSTAVTSVQLVSGNENDISQLNFLILGFHHLMGRPGPASPSFAATERTKSPGRDVWAILVIGGTEMKTGGVSAMLVTATTNSSVATLRESTVPSVQAFWRKEYIPSCQRSTHLADELKHIRGDFFIVKRSLQVNGAPGEGLVSEDGWWSPCLAILRSEVFPHFKIQRCRWRWSNLEIGCQV